MAIRVTHGYRTISYEAALFLARSPPFDILDYIGQNDGEAAPDQEPGMLRRNAHTQDLWARRARLESQGYASQRAVGTILPNFEVWIGRTVSPTD